MDDVIEFLMANGFRPDDSLERWRTPAHWRTQDAGVLAAVEGGAEIRSDDGVILFAVTAKEYN